MSSTPEPTDPRPEQAAAAVEHAALTAEKAAERIARIAALRAQWLAEQAAQAAQAQLDHKDGGEQR